MKYKLIFLALLVCLVIPIASAEYLPHKQKTDLEVIISSNNATECNITYVQYPDGTKTSLNIEMTKSITEFNSTLNQSYFLILGSTCVGIRCSDGNTYETGSVCREITPSGYISTLGFYFILLSILMGIVVLGFSVKEAWFVVMGGMGLIILGVYSLNNGIADFRDTFMTLAISLFEIGIGAFLSINSAIQKMDMD